jgi:hypothetical protein
LLIVVCFIGVEGRMPFLTPLFLKNFTHCLLNEKVLS